MRVIWIIMAFLSTIVGWALILGMLKPSLLAAHAAAMFAFSVSCAAFSHLVETKK